VDDAAAQHHRIGEPAAARRTSLVLALPWCLLLLCIVALKLAPGWEPFRGNDSYQYLSVAQNQQLGLIGRTSLVHWDEERAHGVVPAHLTNFPIGYPVLVGALQATGMSGESAGLAISLLAALGSVLVLDLLARRAGVGLLGRQVALALFATSSITAAFASSVMSEASFTLAVLAGLGLVAMALPLRDGARGSLLPAVAGGLLLGLSYWLRYAGLFMLLGLLAVAAWAWVTGRRSLHRPVLVAFAAGACIVLPGMLRNVMLTESWRGGNVRVVVHPLAEILRDYLRATRDLLMARSLDMPAGRVLAVLLLALLVVAGVIALRQARTPADRDAAQRGDATVAMLLAIVVLTYVACLGYAASRTVIERSVRYFFPLLPLLLVLLGWGVTSVERRLPDRTRRRRWSALWIAIVAVFAVLHVSTFYRRTPLQQHEAVAARLAAPTTSGVSARELILEQLGSDGCLMANAGQATGYVLRHPAVSLIGLENGGFEWDEARVHETMRRFSVKALVVYRVGTDGVADELPSAFLKRLAAGDAPAWLRKAGEAAAVVVYVPAPPS
jgi:MFS family permease